MQTAEAVAQAGAQILRGGAYKPRSSPYAFQGLGVEGLKLLRKASEATGLAVITEVMSEEDVDVTAEYADIMQVGTRSMENYSLLEALGSCGRPVLLKRGMAATLEELLEESSWTTTESFTEAVHRRSGGPPSALEVHYSLLRVLPEPHRVQRRSARNSRPRSQYARRNPHRLSRATLRPSRTGFRQPDAERCADGD